jgi:hypothetical protein
VTNPDWRFISVELVNLLATFRLRYSLFRSTTEVARLHLVFGELFDFNRVLADFGSLGRFVRSLAFHAYGMSAAVLVDSSVYPERVAHRLQELREAQQNMQQLKNLQKVTFAHFLTREAGRKSC